MANRIDQSRQPEVKNRSRNRRQARRVKTAQRPYCQRCNGSRWIVEERHSSVSRDGFKRVAVPCSCTRSKPKPDFKAIAAGDRL